MVDLYARVKGLEDQVRALTDAVMLLSIGNQAGSVPPEHEIRGVRLRRFKPLKEQPTDADAIVHSSPDPAMMPAPDEPVVPG